MFATFLYIAVSVTILALRSKGTDTTATPLQEVAQTVLEAPVTDSNPWDEETQAPTATPALPDLTAAAEVMPEEVTPAPEYVTLTIRQLKALASTKKIKYYGKMTKEQLLTALSHA